MTEIKYPIDPEVFDGFVLPQTITTTTAGNAVTFVFWIGSAVETFVLPDLLCSLTLEDDAKQQGTKDGLPNKPPAPLGGDTALNQTN